MNGPVRAGRPSVVAALGLGISPTWLVICVGVVAASSAWSEVLRVALPEELLFRGVLYGEVERRTGRRLAAVVVAATLFALAHAFVDADPRGLLTFFPALLFGLLRAASGSLWPAVAAHAVANLWWLGISILR